MQRRLFIQMSASPCNNPQLEHQSSTRDRLIIGLAGLCIVGWLIVNKCSNNYPATFAIWQPPCNVTRLHCSWHPIAHLRRCSRTPSVGKLGLPCPPVDAYTQQLTPAGDRMPQLIPIDWTHSIQYGILPFCRNWFQAYQR